jgi:hypothetical protein
VSTDRRDDTDAASLFRKRSFQSGRTSAKFRCGWPGHETIYSRALIILDMRCCLTGTEDRSAGNADTLSGISKKHGTSSRMHM